MEPSWNENLKKVLVTHVGKNQAALLIKKYEHAFSPSYRAENSVEVAANDISYLEQLSPENALEIFFYSNPKNETRLHLRLYLWHKPLPLSELLPVLENLDLRTYVDRNYELELGQDQSIWICDFCVSYVKELIEIDKISKLFKEAFANIYFGLSENDGFNKLILGSLLDWHEIIILRAYAKYLRQINYRYSQAYIEKALVNNSNISKLLVEFFKNRHNPVQTQNEQLEQTILQLLDSVPSLDEDQIIRRILALMNATLRTNYFQLVNDLSNECLSFKLHSRSIPEIPLPAPLYEIFVYSPRFEGVHCRNTKVARGGIRWSERPEDFRTEILGLMKAQVVKNAIIVPSGAKGGFVLKTTPTTREELLKEVVRCYKLFIFNLLSLTDNIKENTIIHPKNVICHDDFDPYLVVAADKGTAALSDTANEIAKNYHFWLGDAFASGGKKGYDHKKMGITARGAWESIKRHFRELNIDVTTTDITVVGIGDMSGDVFGNGMIYSKHIKLIAAFDHRHIFLDPDPNPEVSYYERVRLFNTANSSWEDYQANLISEGGGVFKRSAKSIPLSSAIKKVLNIKTNSLTPNDLIRAILKAPVQLLFNGGIGTYVKASTESTMDVGDRTNDWCRVNGEELQCKVVGEGGNLGFTQLGRIEYALKGGLINTDSIDNSAGVNCSDHEVNLKILLDSQVTTGKLKKNKRDALLFSVTDEVAKLVLKDNYEQALLMSYSAYRAKRNIALHMDYIKELEHQEILDRKIEFIPEEKKLIERRAAGEGLTRPELAILVAYTKIYIKNRILNSTLPEDPYLTHIGETAFPHSVMKKYKPAMAEHRLHRDIVATQLSNHVTNDMGITFVYRLQMETSATVDEIVRAYIIVSRIFDWTHLQKIILSLDFKIQMDMQYEMLYNIRNLLNLATRWFLHHNPYLQQKLETVIAHFSTQIRSLEKILPTLMGGITKEYLESLTQQFMATGLSVEIAHKIATYRTIYSALNIIEVATQNNFDLTKTAEAYYVVGERFNLLWFRDQIARDTREGHWNTLSRLTIRDELDIAQCTLTTLILKCDPNETSISKLMDKWINSNQRTLERWDKLLGQLHSGTDVDYPMFFIATRELISLIT